jgi:hypothetical protein
MRSAWDRRCRSDGSQLVRRAVADGGEQAEQGIDVL